MVRIRMIGFAAACLTTTFAATALAEAPSRWSCDEALYEDGVCDCGCGAVDRDCTSPTFDGCERHACPEGAVPWEHSPEACMGSACGDGWRDEAMGEACDDFEALDSGGCNSDCSAVNDGWICGERAAGCEPDPDATEPDAGMPDGGDADAGGVDAVGGGEDAALGDTSGTDDASGESDADSVMAGGDSGGCAAATSRASGVGFALMGMALVAVRRRR